MYLEPTVEVGVSVRWCPLSSSSKVWHVLEVYPSSPAEIAGFIPFNDYIIGSPEGVLSGETSLGELVMEVVRLFRCMANFFKFLRQPLRFWVYNSTHDIVRVVTIVPDRSWGGEGAMGFNIGYGYLHRIPPVSSNDVVFDSEAPMQTAFELAQQAQQVQQEGQSRQSMERRSSETSRPPIHGRRRASHSTGHSGKKVVGIEDILREGQEKSEKEDYVSSTTTTETLPPPPPKRSSPS